MIVDYVRVNKMKCDCNLQDTISNNIEFANYNYSVKNTLTLSGFTVPIGEKAVFRATNEITLDAGFELPIGSEMELIMQPCPN